MGIQGGYQRNRGVRGKINIVRGVGCPGEEVFHQDERAKLYAFSGKIEFEVSYSFHQ